MNCHYFGTASHRLNCASLGFIVRVRVAHRDDAGTRSEQPRRKGMTQRMPHYSFESGLFTGQLEAGLQIPEASPVICCPASFLDECIQPPLFKIHLNAG